MSDIKPRCAVHGMIRPGAMCGRVIVGMQYCGSGPGTCEHQIMPDDNTSTPEEDAEAEWLMKRQEAR